MEPARSAAPDHLPPAAAASSGYAGLGAREGSAKGQGNVLGRISRMDAILPLRGGTLLDVGCGNGAYTMEMARHFERTVALDIEPDRIEDFRAVCRDGSVEIHLRSATDTGLSDGSVDAVTAIEVVEHLGPHLDDVLTEAHRVLRPGGVLYLTTPNRWWPLEQHGWVHGGRRRPGWQFPFLTWFPPLHRRFSDDAVFTPGQLDRLVEPAGFVRIGLRHMMPPMDGSPVLRRLAGPVLALVERTPLRHLAQTLVMAYERL